MPMQYFTLNELAKHLKVSRRWLQNQVSSGDLPCIHLGGSRRVLRFSLEEVTEWIERHRHDKP